MTSVASWLYTAEETRGLDQAAMAAGIPGDALMERAGEEVVAAIQRRWPDWRRMAVAVLAGGGNNGGDGYVVARRLAELGAKVTVVAVADPGKLKGEAAAAAGRWHDRAGQIVSPPQDLNRFDLLVDALLGTGLDSSVRSPYHEVIEAAHSAPAPVVAVDVPSGLDADTGRILGTVAEASLTVTFVGLKRGLVTGEGVQAAGEVGFSDLGIPASVYQKRPAGGRLLHSGDVALTPRSANAHKGHFGRAVIVGGSRGMAGAAALAGRAALRTGSGWTVACVDPLSQDVVAGFRPELITAPWADQGALPEDLREGADAVAVGPGLGRSREALALLGEAIALPVPLVVDADGLNLIAEDPDLARNVARREAATVVTPHPGEAARLLGDSTGAVQSDRFAAAVRIAGDLGAVCCLKGAGTVIARPEGGYSVSPTGNPGMAMGGQGDCLTGILVARLGGGDPPDRAAERGVWAHGAAADRLARAQGPFGFLPSECADALPAIWAELTRA